MYVKYKSILLCPNGQCILFLNGSGSCGNFIALYCYVSFHPRSFPSLFTQMPIHNKYHTTQHVQAPQHHMRTTRAYTHHNAHTTHARTTRTPHAQMHTAAHTHAHITHAHTHAHTHIHTHAHTHARTYTFTRIMHAYVWCRGIRVVCAACVCVHSTLHLPFSLV